MKTNTLLNKLLRLLGLYDSNGLKYSISHLNSIQREIAFYPIEKQAKYVDKICKDNFEDDFYVFQSKQQIMRVENVRDLNATGIGNLAYITLNTKDMQLKEKGLFLLNDYKQYLQQFNRK